MTASCEAVKAGADAVLFNGGPDISGEDIELERTMIRIISTLRRECERYGMPLLAEMVPGGFNPPQEYISIDSLKLAARGAAEGRAGLLARAGSGRGRRGLPEDALPARL